jgi:hypothetical protein
LTTGDWLPAKIWARGSQPLAIKAHVPAWYEQSHRTSGWGIITEFVAEKNAILWDVRTDVSEESIAIIRPARIVELETMLAVTSNC